MLSSSLSPTRDPRGTALRAGRGRAGSAAAEAETRCRGGKVAGRGAPRHLPAPCGVGAYSPGKGGAGAKQTHQLPHKGARGPGTCTPAGHGSQRPSAALRTAKAPPHRAAVRPWGQQDFLQLGVGTGLGPGAGRHGVGGQRQKGVDLGARAARED